MSYIYIIQSTTSGKFYIGYTKNLELRILQHQTDLGGWTKGRGPWILKYYETYEVDSDARRRELQLKQKKRVSYFEWLFANGNGTTCID